jgi:hypothetical protein
MTMEERIGHIDRALAKLTATWFVNGDELTDVAFTREERALVVAALEVAGGVCALLAVKEEKR